MALERAFAREVSACDADLVQREEAQAGAVLSGARRADADARCVGAIE